MYIKNTQAMRDLGRVCAGKYQKILLHGVLGAGKTTFVKWFAQWLGLDPQSVHSPTYTYINMYDEKLLHIDMYRLETAKDLIEKWILDAIAHHDFIVIERPKFEHYYID